MLTPPNYVDLFDRLYPEQQLTGLTDDGQITVEELNQRYAIQRANQRTMMTALQGIWQALPDGSRFGDFVAPFWEVAVSRVWNLDAPQVALLTYRHGFDAAGTGLDFPEERIALRMNDLGGAEFGNAAEVLVFVDGRLVGPSAYLLSSVQGGFTVYLKKEVGVRDVPIRVVALRKFGERGVTHGASPMLSAGAGDPSSGYPITVQDLGAYGPVMDIRYYHLFTRTPGDQFFRPVDLAKFVARADDATPAALFLYLDQVVAGQLFIVVNVASFWKAEYETLVTDASDVWRVKLTYPDGQPAPVARIEDVDVWLDGRLLRPSVDFWLSWNRRNPTKPPHLIFKGIPPGQRHLFVIANAPYDQELELTIDEPGTITDPRAIYDLPRAQHLLRLVDNVGIASTGGYVDSVGDSIKVVAENIGVHLKGLSDDRELKFRARFVWPPGLLAAALQGSVAQTPLERLVEMLQPSGGFGVDFVDKYRGENPTPVPHLDYRPETRPGYFGAGYFWTRDEQAAARTAYVAVDCRPGQNEHFDPWRQGGADGHVLFDCRVQPEVLVDARDGAASISYINSLDAREGHGSGLADFRYDTVGLVLDGRYEGETGLVDARNGGSVSLPQQFWGQAAAQTGSIDFREGAADQLSVRPTDPATWPDWARLHTTSLSLDFREQ
jgi:hypothetical protein